MFCTEIFFLLDSKALVFMLFKDLLLPYEHLVNPKAGVVPIALKFSDRGNCRKNTRIFWSSLKVWETNFDVKKRNKEFVCAYK